MCAMATPSKASSWNFYLMGREERRLLKHEIDLEAAAKRFVAENPVDYVWREWLREACSQAEKLVSTRSKNEWLREYAKEITASGVDENVAYRWYLAGRVDELCYALEEELIAHIGNEVDDASGEVSVH